MKKRKAKRNRVKTTQGIITGTQFGWECRDPLADRPEIEKTWLDHKNPIKKILVKNQHRTFNEITERCVLKWSVDIEVEFKDQNGKQYFRAANLLIHGKLREANDVFLKTIEEIFEVSNMRHYVTCRMTAEMIGTDAINDRDREAA